ncbi:glycosyl hydrolase family 28-related protein [Priestia megaterium]
MADMIARGLAKKAASAVVNVKDFGAKGDGINDDTVAIQNAINSISSGTVVIPNGNFIVHDIKVDGKSNINLICYGVLKLIDNCPLNQGILIINNSTNINIDLALDCNVQNNGVTLKQQSHGLKILSSSFITGSVVANNICGDGIYISNNSSNIVLDKVIGNNVTDAGRNTISIVQGSNIRIKHIESIKVGNIDMPSGFDIEPNANTETVKNVTVDYAYIDSIGTAGFSINNSRKGTVENITVNKLIVMKGANSPDGKSAITIDTANNVQISEFITDCNYLNIGVQILYSDGIYVKGLAKKSSHGVFVTSSTNVKVASKLIDTKNNAVVLSGTSSNIDLDINPINCNAQAQSSTSVGWCVRLDSTAVITNLKVTGNMSKQGNTRGVITISSGGTLSGATFEKANCSGYANVDIFKTCGDLITKKECVGVNYGTTTPTDGEWKAGDFIHNTTYTVLNDGTDYVIEKWLCRQGGRNTGVLWLPVKQRI